MRSRCPGGSGRRVTGAGQTLWSGSKARPSSRARRSARGIVRGNQRVTADRTGRVRPTRALARTAVSDPHGRDLAADCNGSGRVGTRFRRCVQNRSVRTTQDRQSRSRCRRVAPTRLGRPPLRRARGRACPPADGAYLLWLPVFAESAGAADGGCDQQADLDRSYPGSGGHALKLSGGQRTGIH